MAAPRKSKRDELAQTRDQGQPMSSTAPDYESYRASSARPVSVRLDDTDIQELKRFATDRGLKQGQALRLILKERLAEERAKAARR